MKVTLTAALGAAPLLAPLAASAQYDKSTAYAPSSRHGTLQVKGGDQDNSVTLRLAADNPQVVQVEIGADGSRRACAVSGSG